MIRANPFFCLSLVVLSLWGSVAGAEDRAPVLSTNPFERPAWISDARAAPPADGAATQRGPIDLRATLLAGAASLANVDGRIIAIGEEVGGYRLVSVAQGKAIFSLGDERITVTVVNEKKDKDSELD